MKEPDSHRTIFDIKTFLSSWKPVLNRTDDNAPSTNDGEYQTMIRAETRPWIQYMLIAITMLQTVLVLLGNGPLISAWLLTIFIAGTGQSLLLPPRVGIFGGILVVILWVLFRQVTGIWSNAVLAQNLLETVGLISSIGLAIQYRQLWDHQRDTLQTLGRLHNVLVAGESGTGLVAQEVAELRLTEETDRAKLFGRPLSLLLLDYFPISNQYADPLSLKEIDKAITRKLAGVSIVHDIPFRRGDCRVGLILLERDWEKLDEDVNEIVQSVLDTMFVDLSGKPQSITNAVQLRFGLGTYQGEPAEAIDLMRAAKHSLQIERTVLGIGEGSEIVYPMSAAPQFIHQESFSLS